MFPRGAMFAFFFFVGPTSDNFSFPSFFAGTETSFGDCFTHGAQSLAGSGSPSPPRGSDRGCRGSRRLEPTSGGETRGAPLEVSYLSPSGS